MSINDLIEALQDLAVTLGPDAEVLAQSHGCCRHGHEIQAVEAGEADEAGSVVIRV